MLGEGRVGMGGDLRVQLRPLSWRQQAGAAGPGTGQPRPRAGALAQPAIDRGRIVLKERGDVSHTTAAIHCGQGSFTDIVGGVRALHPRSVPDWHIYVQPL